MERLLQSACRNCVMQNHALTCATQEHRHRATGLLSGAMRHAQRNLTAFWEHHAVSSWSHSLSRYSQEILPRRQRWSLPRCSALQRHLAPRRLASCPWRNAARCAQMPTRWLSPLDYDGSMALKSTRRLRKSWLRATRQNVCDHFCFSQCLCCWVLLQTPCCDVCSHHWHGQCASAFSLSRALAWACSASASALVERCDWMAMRRTCEMPTISG
mmetsp:Transcript_55930/g.105201  ORF Transcript_55930/g.105201 Transcript_55930/m.105201 type:complete len:214 (-) Transcript_55930:553-1194(-)